MNNDSKTNDKTQELFDIKEAAKFLGVSVRTLKRWHKSGKLVPDTLEMKKSNFGPRLVTNYSLAQLRLVTNSRYEHQKKVTNSETSDKLFARSTKTSDKFAETSAKFEKSVAKVTENKPTASKLTYIDEEAETLIKNSVYIAPVTLYSPKDKVSNLFWKNELPLNNENFAVVTVRKSEDFGCIVNLDYDKILENEDIITGAELSPFDRSVYDAVVSLCVAGNNIFNTTQLWRVICKNPNAKLTDVERIKIVKSMFHIARFWMSIITDHSKKPEVWKKFNSDSPFKSERKFYKKLKTAYFGRLLDFRGLAVRDVDFTVVVDGQEVVKNKTVPEIWQIIATPLLYQYARDKEQVVSVLLNYLNTSDRSNKQISIKRGDHTDEVADFLTCEIDTMKKTAKSRSPYSTIITLERIYLIDGINDIKTDSNSLNKKKKKSRDKIDKILSHFKDSGMITGHIFHKKKIGKVFSFYSVEVLL